MVAICVPGSFALAVPIATATYAVSSYDMP